MDHYRLINERRRDFLDNLLDVVLSGRSFKRTADLGCGYGFFADHLTRRGHHVEAYDGRPENVAEAARRYPAIPFQVWDIEDKAGRPAQPYEFVLCFGLLYHLENPFLAIRNLAAVTQDIAVIETVIAEHTMPAAVMYDEPARGEAQALQYLALIPTESGLVKMLSAAGFPFIYRPAPLPDHPDFVPGGLKLRTVLVTARTELAHPSLTCLKDSPNYVTKLNQG
jgi:SAM-dependent methyltransferase